MCRNTFSFFFFTPRKTATYKLHGRKNSPKHSSSYVVCMKITKFNLLVRIRKTYDAAVCISRSNYLILPRRGVQIWVEVAIRSCGEFKNAYVISETRVSSNGNEDFTIHRLRRTQRCRGLIALLGCSYSVSMSVRSSEFLLDILADSLCRGNQF